MAGAAYELEVSVKCGYCAAVCTETAVSRHKCFNIFSEFFIDPDSNTAWGVNENGEGVYELNTDARINKENVSNNAVNQKICCNNSSKIYSNKSFQCKIDEEEKLILEVMERPALWDITIPLSQRGKNLKSKLWIEVSESLKGCFTADGAKKRFKSLTDTFRKMLQNEKCPSGSGRKTTTTNRWPHYNTMQFLRNQLNCRPTTSNLIYSDEEVAGNISNEDEIEELDVEKSCKRKAKKRKGVEENDHLMASFDKIAEAISGSRDIILPPPPVSDEVDSCLNIIGCRLRKLTEDKMSSAINDLVHYSYELLQKYKK